MRTPRAGWDQSLTKSGGDGALIMNQNSQNSKYLSCMKMTVNHSFKYVLLLEASQEYVTFQWHQTNFLFSVAAGKLQVVKWRIKTVRCSSKLQLRTLANYTVSQQEQTAKTLCFLVCDNLSLRLGRQKSNPFSLPTRQWLFVSNYRLYISL